MSPRHPRPRAALVLACLLALTCLTACRSAVGQLREAADHGPTDGGVLQIGSTNDLVPASIFNGSGDADYLLLGNVFDTLVTEPSDGGAPRPSLATSWHEARDGRSMTLRLRHGVTFHTGRAFTSQDVAFSIRTWADPVWSVQLQRTAAAITGFDTSRPDTITLHFAHRLGNVMDLLGMMPIIDRDTFAQLKAGTRYVGTGPFVFDSWKPGSSITLSRNDHYWGNEPHLAGVKINIVSDAEAQVSQLRTGQLDLVTGGSNTDLQELSHDSRFHVTRMTGAENNVYVGADLTDPQLKDVRLRQAIAYALDRKRIADEVYRGAAVPASLPWPSSSPAYDPTANAHYFRDLTKARALAKQVGDVGTIPLDYPAGNPNLEATAQIVQADLQQIGVSTRLDPIDNATFTQKLVTGTFGGLWVLTHLYAQYAPGTLAVSAYPFNAEKNASHYVGARYQADSTRAWELDRTTGPAAQTVYRRLNQDLLSSAFLLEIAVIYPQVVSGGVSGLTWTKRGELELDHAYLDDPDSH